MAKKWLDSMDKEKSSNLKERDRHPDRGTDIRTDRQSQLLTVMTPS